MLQYFERFLYITVDYKQGNRHLKRSYKNDKVNTGTEAEDDLNVLPDEQAEETILSLDDAKKNYQKCKVS